MGNLVWTFILYASTVGIVYVTYRAFIVDRKAEREGKTQDMINKAYKNKPKIVAEPVIPAEPRRRSA
jgi:hypothetical protein